MITKFDIGDKVYYDLPLPKWGWVDKISITAEDHIVYAVRTPYGQIHYKLEKALRKDYYGKERENTQDQQGQ